MPVIGTIEQHERSKNGGAKENRNTKARVLRKAFHERLKDRIPLVVRMVALGYTYAEIGKELNLKTITVDKIYAREIKRVRQARLRETEYIIDKTELQYQTVIKECFLAFERSKVNRKNQPVKPDVAYIDRVLQALEAIRKLRGLDKEPSQQQINPNNAQFNWYSLVQAPALAQLPQANPNVTVNEPNVQQSSAQPTKDRTKDDADMLIEALNNRAKELGIVKDSNNEQSSG